MPIEPKDYPFLWKVAAFIVGGASTGSVAVYKFKQYGKRLDDHDEKIASLEKSKINKTDCQTIQVEHKEKFIDGNNEFKEVKKLIKESEEKTERRIKEHSELTQKHHEDLMKLLIESLKQ